MSPPPFSSKFLDTSVSVRGKHVLVIGSEVPWFEAILLSKGAKRITTFDYVKIESRHPQVSWSHCPIIELTLKP